MKLLPSIDKQHRKLRLNQTKQNEKTIKIKDNILNRAYESASIEKHFLSTVPISKLKEERGASFTKLELGSRKKLRISSIKIQRTQKPQTSIEDEFTDSEFIKYLILYLENLQSAEFQCYGKLTQNYFKSQQSNGGVPENFQKQAKMITKVIQTIKSNQFIKKDIFSFIFANKNQILPQNNHRTLKSTKQSYSNSHNLQILSLLSFAYYPNSQNVDTPLNQFIKLKEQQYKRLQQKLESIKSSLQQQEEKINLLKEERNRIQDEISQYEKKIKQIQQFVPTKQLQNIATTGEQYRKCKMSIFKLSTSNPIPVEKHSLSAIQKHLTDQFTSIIVSYPSENHLWIITEGIQRLKAFVQGVISTYNVQMRNLIQNNQKQEKYIRDMEESIEAFIGSSIAKTDAIAALKLSYTKILLQIEEEFKNYEQHDKNDKNDNDTHVEDETATLQFPNDLLQQIFKIGVRMSKSMKSISKKNLKSGLKKSRVRFDKIDEHLQTKKTDEKLCHSSLSIQNQMAKDQKFTVFAVKLKKLIKLAQQVYLASITFE